MKTPSILALALIALFSANVHAEELDESRNAVVVVEQNADAEEVAQQEERNEAEKATEVATEVAEAAADVAEDAVDADLV
ncbi:MAG: hypothetical protein ACOYK9_03345 [Chlamydiia bacterium]